MGIIDRLDDVLTTGRARARDRREAAKFERACEPGVEYWSIEECDLPWGIHSLFKRKWIFKKGLLGGLSCGPHSPAYVWMNYGPLLTKVGDHIPDLMTGDAEDHAPTEAQLKKITKDLADAFERSRKALDRV